MFVPPGRIVLAWGVLSSLYRHVPAPIKDGMPSTPSALFRDGCLRKWMISNLSIVSLHWGRLTSLELHYYTSSNTPPLSVTSSEKYLFNTYSLRCSWRPRPGSICQTSYVIPLVAYAQWISEFIPNGRNVYSLWRYRYPVWDKPISSVFCPASFAFLLSGAHAHTPPSRIIAFYGIGSAFFELL